MTIQGETMAARQRDTGRARMAEGGVRRAYAALGLPILSGAEIATEPSIEVALPDEMRAFLAEPQGAVPAAAPSGRDPDALPTVMSGAHQGDDTADLEIVTESPIAPELAVAAAEPAEPVAPAPPTLDPKVARRAEQAVADLERIEEEVSIASALRRAQRPAALPVHVPDEELTDEEWQKIQGDAVEAAKTAEDFGVAIGSAFDQLRLAQKQLGERRKAKLEQATQQAKQTQAEQERLLKIKTLEDAARERYPDFDAVLTATKMWAQVAEPQSQDFNPSVSKIVYGAVDLADRAYWLARAQIGRQHGLDPKDPKVTEIARGAGSAPPAAPTAPAAPAPAPAAPVAPRDAAQVRREVTSQVVDQLAQNSARPAGIDNLRPAGRPTSRFTIPELDRMQRETPDAYRRLIDASPDLDYFHMSGGLTRG